MVPLGVADGAAGHGRPGISPELDLRHQQDQPATKRKRGPTRLARTSNRGGRDAADQHTDRRKSHRRPPMTTGSTTRTAVSRP